MRLEVLDAGAVTGFDPAAFTRRASRRHRTRSVAAVLLDGYTVLLAVFVGALFGYGLLTALHAKTGVAAERPVTDAAVAVIPAGACLPVLGLALTAMVLVAAARLGPIGPDAAALAWWLRTPVPRGRMLTRIGLARVGAGAAVVTVLLLPVLAGVTLGPALVLGAVTGGLAAAIAVEVAVSAQATGRSRLLPRVTAALGVTTTVAVVGLAVCGWLAPAVVPVIAGAVTWLPSGWFVLAAHGAMWPFVVLVVVAVALGLPVSRRTGAIPTPELARAGGTLLMLRLWAVTGGADDLVRASPTRSSRSSLPSRSSWSSRSSRSSLPSRSSWPTRSSWSSRLLGRVRTPAGALITADVFGLVRQGGWWAVAVLPAVAWLPALVTGVNGLLPVAAVLLIVALIGMNRSARLVRACAAVPELDGLLPLSAARTRRLHAVVPGLLLAGMMTVLCAGLVVLGAADAGLVLLGALAGAGLGACAVRSAYRPPVDFASPPVPTPFGYLPSSALAGMAQGPDLAVVVLVPVVVALAIGATAPLLLAAQAAVVLVVVLAATTPRLTD